MLRRSILALLLFGLLAACAQPKAADLREGIGTSAEIIRPKGEGPFPAIILLHGCGGRYPHETAWGEALARAGFLVYIPDSFAARGWSRSRGRRTTCNGLGLWGKDRAVDVLHAMALLESLPGADARRVALMGFSHGGWTALDLLAMAQDGGEPDWPAGAAKRLAELRGVVTVYPYCGFAARSASPTWTSPAPMLFLHAAEDRTVSNADCQELAARQRARGVRVLQHIYPGVGHGFDFDPSQNDGYSRSYDAATTADAMRRTAEFLLEVTGR